jgi:hypothetical protein
MKIKKNECSILVLELIFLPTQIELLVIENKENKNKNKLPLLCNDGKRIGECTVGGGGLH